MKEKRAVLHITPDARLDQCAREITQALHKTVEGIFETGRLLVQWKEKLEHGEWERMFNERRVPISAPVARSFMRVWQARERLLPKRNHGYVLPASYRTLDELASLPEDTLAWAHEHGKITPDLERAQVKHIRAEFEKVPAEKKPSRIETPGSRLVTRVIRLLRVVNDFTVDDRAYVITMLRQHLEQMDDEQKPSEAL